MATPVWRISDGSFTRGGRSIMSGGRCHRSCSTQLNSATATTADQADACDGGDATDAGHRLGARGLGQGHALVAGSDTTGDRQRGHRSGERQDATVETSAVERVSRRAPAEIRVGRKSFAEGLLSPGNAGSSPVVRVEGETRDRRVERDGPVVGGLVVQVILGAGIVPCGTGRKVCVLDARVISASCGRDDGEVDSVQRSVPGVGPGCERGDDTGDAGGRHAEYGDRGGGEVRSFHLFILRSFDVMASEAVYFSVGGGDHSRRSETKKDSEG